MKLCPSLYGYPQKKLSTFFKAALCFGRKYFELKQLNAYLWEGVRKEKSYIVGLTKEIFNAYVEITFVQGQPTKTQNLV